jgi:hypothetical protein
VLEDAGMTPRIDRNIKSFVMKLNRIKGVYPASSCGGHAVPSGSKQPEGEFFVIMNVWNFEFLRRLFMIQNENESYCHIEYHPLHETWCLYGFTLMIDWDLEPLVDEYISNPSNLKQKSEWKKFYSYGDYPIDTNGMSNSKTLEMLKVVLV